MRPPYSNNIHIFIGPTLSGFERRLKDVANDIIWHPPVKRNDINFLCQTNQPATIVVVDGYFHTCLAVSHKEIREAIKAGWVVWGISSMGAIRASEMILLGMKGYGVVYNHFVNDKDFRDDEVALLHGFAKPFIPISEPLIHIRYFLNYIQEAKQITTKEKNKIIRVLSSIWYGDRTLYLLKELLIAKTGFSDEKSIDGLIADFQKFRVKSIDFIDFMTSKIWLS
jgi:hypothetical protein